jgi:hypothetical protein
MRESAGRNKGREEGDVRTIRRGGGGGEWMLWTVIAEPAVLAENYCILR